MRSRPVKSSKAFICRRKMAFVCSETNLGVAFSAGFESDGSWKRGGGGGCPQKKPKIDSLSAP